MFNLLSIIKKISVSLLLISLFTSSCFATSIAKKKHVYRGSALSRGMTRVTHHKQHKKQLTKKSVAHRKKRFIKQAKRPTHIKHPIRLHKLHTTKNKRKPAQIAKAAQTPVKHNLLPTQLPAYLLSNTEQALVEYVQKTINNLRYSVYKLGGQQIDPKRGVYVVDCSSYIDYILKSTYPNAFSELATWSGSEKPTTNDFYSYFNTLKPQTNQRWTTIDDVEKLRPGDIIVFRYKNSLGNETGGHVMVVMDKPISNKDHFLVRVADSATTGHSKDTRPQRKSGIGIGTLLLKTDPKTYQPVAYAWRIGSRWERNVNFAMARPIDIS